MWAQHIVYIKFAMLFLQCKFSGLQNVSGCCQPKFGFCNAFGQCLYTQGRCFWNSQHMHGAPPRWISSSGNLDFVHLSGANFFLLLFCFFFNKWSLSVEVFPKIKLLPCQNFGHLWANVWGGQSSGDAKCPFLPKGNIEPSLAIVKIYWTLQYYNTLRR